MNVKKKIISDHRKGSNVSQSKNLFCKIVEIAYSTVQTIFKHEIISVVKLWEARQNIEENKTS